MPEFCWILRDHPGDREQNIVNDGAIQFLPAEEQFDSTGLFHWCTARPFNEVILVGCFIRRLFIPQHDHVMKWKHFPRYWPFVRGIHRSPVNSPHKGQWRGALMFSLICVWINDWVNNREAGDLRRYRAHCNVTVMNSWVVFPIIISFDYYCDTLLYICDISVWNCYNRIYIYSAPWILMACCFSTRALVATMVSIQPCISNRLGIIEESGQEWELLKRPVAPFYSHRLPSSLAGISNHMASQLWDENYCACQTCTVDIW